MFPCKTIPAANAFLQAIICLADKKIAEIID